MQIVLQAALRCEKRPAARPCVHCLDGSTPKRRFRSDLPVIEMKLPTRQRGKPSGPHENIPSTDRDEDETPCLFECSEIVDVRMFLREPGRDSSQELRIMMTFDKKE